MGTGMGEVGLPIVAERVMKENTSGSGGGHIRSITWLRIVATFLVAVYHAVRFFDETPADIDLADAQFQFFLERFSRFLTQWHMPLFFVLSGFSLRLSFSKGRALADVLRERVHRLLVPFVSCIFLVVIPQLYILEVFRRGWTGGRSFFTVFIDFFRPEGFSWAHLWYLLVLFCFTVAHSPLLLALLRWHQLALPLPVCVALAVAVLLVPLACAHSLRLAGFVLGLTLAATALALGLRRALFAPAAAALCIALLSTLVAHAFALPTLAVHWPAVYAVLVATALLLAAAAAAAPGPAGAASGTGASAAGGWRSLAPGLLAAAGVLAVALLHVRAVSAPPVFPPRRGGSGAVAGFQLAEILYMLAHFAPFFVAGFAAAVFAPQLAACAPLVQLAGWLPVLVLVAVPLLGVTLPAPDGYLILVGNFPTYAGSLERLFYHSGAWGWIAVLAATAHLGCRESPSEPAERYLGRATITVYTTHILFDYLGAFLARALFVRFASLYWLPVLATCVFVLLANLAFHHWVVLRSPRLQWLLGVK